MRLFRRRRELAFRMCERCETVLTPKEPGPLCARCVEEPWTFHDGTDYEWEF